MASSGECGSFSGCASSMQACQDGGGLFCLIGSPEGCKYRGGRIQEKGIYLRHILPYPNAAARAPAFQCVDPCCKLEVLPEPTLRSKEDASCGAVDYSKISMESDCDSEVSTRCTALFIF